MSRKLKSEPIVTPEGVQTTKAEAENLLRYLDTANDQLGELIAEAEEFAKAGYAVILIPPGNLKGLAFIHPEEEGFKILVRTKPRPAQAA